MSEHAHNQRASHYKADSLSLTGACTLLMYFSMVINESLVARTFGTYALQLFDTDNVPW